MLENLAEPDKRLVGIKQVSRALKAGELKKVYIALDADEELKKALVRDAKEAHVDYEFVAQKKKLGAMCKISVSAACAGLFK